LPIDQSLRATVKGYQQNVVLIRGPALGDVVVALHFDTPGDFKNSHGAAGRAWMCTFAGRIICSADFPSMDNFHDLARGTFRPIPAQPSPLLVAGVQATDDAIEISPTFDR
jgi:hypothetical protein